MTTLRADVETDGRRAVVAFTDDWEEDARRRDFTLNALYATADGRVLDPVGGLSDLAARKLRFVGDAHARITEDYLRILRFFRFFAYYGQFRPDADGLRASARANQVELMFMSTPTVPIAPLAVSIPTWLPVSLRPSIFSLLKFDS